MTVELDQARFNSRLKSLLTFWSESANHASHSHMSECDALLIIAGDPSSSSEDEDPRLNSTFHEWLLGYEFPSTFIMVQKEQVVIVTSPKKAEILVRLRSTDNPVPLNIHAMEKGKPPGSALARLTELYGQLHCVGYPMNEINAGANIDEWRKAVSNLPRVPRRVDITQALSVAMCESFRGSQAGC